MTKIRFETVGQPIEFEIEDSQTLGQKTLTEAQLAALSKLAQQGPKAVPGIIKLLERDEPSIYHRAALQVLMGLHAQGADISATYPALLACIADDFKFANVAAEWWPRLGLPGVRWLMQRLVQDPAHFPSRLLGVLTAAAPAAELLEVIGAGARSQDEDARFQAVSLIDELFKAKPEAACPELVALLLEAQSDASSWVRRMARAALVGAPGTVEVDFARVVRQIVLEDADALHFGTEFRILGAQRARARHALPALQEFIGRTLPDPKGAHHEVRANVTNALCMIDPENMGRYLRALVDIEGAVTSWQTLLHIEGDLLPELMGEWLADPRPTVVSTALATAAMTGYLGAEFSPEFVRLLNHADPEVQLAAARALRDTAKLLLQYGRDARDAKQLPPAGEFLDAVQRVAVQLEAAAACLPKLKAPVRKALAAGQKAFEQLQNLLNK